MMIKTNHKTILLFIVFIIVTTSQSSGQIGNLIKGFVSNDQVFIQSAVDSAIFIIRQDYVLVDKASGTEYGYGGRTYFGRSYHIAVLSGDRLYVTEDIMKPWEADSNYSSYATVDTIIPKNTTPHIRSLHQEDYAELEVTDFNPVATTGIGFFNFKSEMKGLSNTGAESDDQGWIVILQTNAGEINDESALNFAIYKAEPGSGDSANSAIKTQSNTRIIGGFFIRSTISTGTVKFIFDGLVVRINEKWGIIQFPEKTDRISSGNVLTPIKPDDKDSTKEKKIPRINHIDD